MFDGGLVLSARDFSLLKDLVVPYELEERDAVLRLLRIKLDEARIMLPDDLSPEVVTIDSRVRYWIGHDRVEQRTLVAGPTLSALMLSLLTPRGMAILGMRAGQSVTVDGDTLSIEAVVQPARPGEAGDVDSVRGNVIALSRSNLRPAPRPHTTGDDPGPSAA